MRKLDTTDSQMLGVASAGVSWHARLQMQSGIDSLKCLRQLLLGRLGVVSCCWW